MNYNLIIFGVVFLILAYMVGVKKQVWILSGFNQARVKDKDKLARIAGFYLFAPLGLLLLVSGFISFPHQELILTIFGIGYGLCVIIYVNEKMI
ncbi:DUF3784 domain-containing protein [Radiobacillus kanasensis]|uniref:DUF3784 domain-containing protein n=1 Tax=Radiobacillus kanasensis TaxID=2844358 RepID=UPI001E3E67ED|nr:DUF3784 domain-containing protein [Radiobacillus kanasensis]UFT99133.1 DUF3784 domain-containing protein [Radiobacillus kanasensis]